MERPTTKEVEYALEWFSQSIGGPGGVLAAEVRALREESALLRAKYKRDLSSHSCNSGGGPDMCGGCCECMEKQFGQAPHDDAVDQLRATIARIEARADAWAASSRKWNGLGCAQDVRVALKGEP